MRPYLETNNRPTLREPRKAAPPTALLGEFENAKGKGLQGQGL